MERRMSLGGHLSFSTSNLASPLAESTQLNGNGSQIKFPWGGKMSPAKKSPATTPNNGISVIQKTVPKVVMSPTRKIDPRIYTDVQSNGLTSRIVKYHENSTRLNRSMSVGNLYSKPGQFPVVHLKRSEVQVQPRRNPSISVVRIAPPDKTLYQANMRSSILRTGSIVPTARLDRSDEKNSRDNRPILPPAENDVNPTRSVLDALKEISRKRINSDEVDCSDTVKKYCKETDDDPRRNLHLPLTAQSQQVSVITKRQREVPSPTESKNNSPDNNIAAVKKRPCTKNNDITSSLSSSLLINTPKRKLQDIHGRPAIGRYSPSSSSLAPPQPKQQCNERNYVITDGSVTDSNAFKYPPDQLTPIPSTPAAEIVVEKPKIVDERVKAAPVTPQKPRLTLFDKDYDTTPTIQSENIEIRQPEEEGIAGISFIKPKKSSPVFSGKNALIERVQTSKLSLMLSCLSGELNENDDEADSKGTDKSKVIDPPVEKPSVSLSISLAPPTSAASQLIVNNPVAPSSATNAITNATPITTTATQNQFNFGVNPAVAIGVTIPKLDTAASSTLPKPAFNFGTNVNTTNSTSVATTTSSGISFATTIAPPLSIQPLTAASTAISVPAGAFSFGVPKPTEITTSAAVTTTTSATLAAAPTVGIFALGTSKQTSAATSTTSTTTLPLGSAGAVFGVPTTTPTQTKPLFNFGPPPSSNVGATTTVTASSTAPIISFGTPVVSKPLPMFGSVGISTTSSTSTTSTMSQQGIIPAFSATTNQSQMTPVFGSVGSAFSSTASSLKSPPKYGETGNTTTIASPAASGFSFGGSQQPVKAAPAIFGSSTNTALTATPSNTTMFNFGASGVNKSGASAPAFNFSASPATTTSAIVPFGEATTTSVAPTTQSLFGFGSSAGTAPAQSTHLNFQNAIQQPQGTTAGFSFGSNTTSNATPFAFSGSTTNALPPPQTTKSFSFGGGNAASAFATVSGPKPATGGFSFNASTATTAESKNIFGSTTIQPSKSFSFSTANKTDQQSHSTTAFGSPPASNATFGAPSMTPGKLFSFGATPTGDSNNSSIKPPSTNIFGSPAPSINNNTSAPLFAAAANIVSSPFGAASNPIKTAAPPMFNFGGSTGNSTANHNTNNSLSTTTSGAFSFGSAVAQPTTTASKSFSFGSSSTPAPGNMFGSTTTNTPTAFNFSSNTRNSPANGLSTNNNNNNNNPLGSVVNANSFAPMGGAAGTDVSNFQRREIRTATRRLKPK